MTRPSALNSVRVYAKMLIEAIDAENRKPTDGDRPVRTDAIAEQVAAAIKSFHPEEDDRCGF